MRRWEVRLYDDSLREPKHISMHLFARLAGAAAFFAMREYEKHQAENGNPPSHAFAKELMAGIAAAEVGVQYPLLHLLMPATVQVVHVDFSNGADL